MQDELNAVRALLTRNLGASADRIAVELQPRESGEEVFVVECRDGVLSASANSKIALCRGVYHYLRESGLGQSSWSGDAISLPAILPTYPRTRIASLATSRHYLSVCTYGYSVAWWDWPRWEQELDWMAWHGINTPLLLSGTEAITKRLFLRLGLSEEAIADHFSGPAYLCWNRLGNLNGFQGPLPKGWIDQQEELQGKILGRACQLGMQPIIPGFSGFVPKEFQALFPNARLFSAEPWAGFDPTHYLDPRGEFFRKAGRIYLDEYRKAYGPAHHYLCELFAEQIPTLDPQTEFVDLEETGRAIWETLVLADPDANWVMQGWPFYFARDYWQPERTSALLRAAPAGRVFVLDLATDELETWRQQPAMREKGWLFNVVHNYGQNTHLHGDLKAFADRAKSAFRDPDRGFMQGMGISPEGIDQNPVVYELLTDLMWSSRPDSIEDWIESYARSRYSRTGGENCWRQLIRTIYGPELLPHFRYSWRFRPGDQPLVASPDPGHALDAVRSLFADSGKLGSRSNYRRDLVDLAKTWLGGIADRYLEEALQYSSLEARHHFFEILGDLDELLATRPEHRLSTWLDAARSCLPTAADLACCERNARTLITWWGGPFLFDYATREWAGLVCDFHSARWRLWFDWLDGKASEPDFVAWEKAWCERESAPEEAKPRPELEVVNELLEKYELLTFKPDPHFEVSRPIIRMVHGSVTMDFGQPRKLRAAAWTPYFGQGLRARYLAESSLDGQHWSRVPLDGCAAQTCKGGRARLNKPVRFLRIGVQIVQGKPEQQFQVSLFA